VRRDLILALKGKATEPDKLKLVIMFCGAGTENLDASVGQINLDQFNFA
jgi:hypothetical protein